MGLGWIKCSVNAQFNRVLYVIHMKGSFVAYIYICRLYSIDVLCCDIRVRHVNNNLICYVMLLIK